MYKSYEIDYCGRSYLLGTSKTIKEACQLEKKALRKSKGEFPTFSEDGKKQVTNNGKLL